MARSADSARLIEAHRVAQVRLGAIVAAQGADLWRRLVDPADLDGSVPAFLRAVAPLVETNRVGSARLAAGFYGALRAGELGPTGFVAELAGAPEPAALVTSLTVTGPIRVKAAMLAGRPLDSAMRKAEVSVAGAAMRHALTGGRETLLRSVRSDRRAKGWERVTSGSACEFCQEVASSGPFTGDASFDAHDHCSCSAAPVFG